MPARTYVDAVAAVRDWINSRTMTLVGPGNPLQKGAHLRHMEGAANTCYAYLFALPAVQFGGAENPTMLARISAQVYGATLEAVSVAAVALADEICVELAGRPVTVNGVTLLVGDDLTGPSDLPDGPLARHVIDFSVGLAPG